MLIVLMVVRASTQHSFIIHISGDSDVRHTKDFSALVPEATHMLYSFSFIRHHQTLIFTFSLLIFSAAFALPCSDKVCIYYTGQYYVHYGSSLFISPTLSAWLFLK